MKIKPVLLPRGRRYFYTYTYGTYTLISTPRRQAHEQDDITQSHLVRIFFNSQAARDGRTTRQKIQSSGGGEDAELLLPVLPKPARLVMFDSEQPHMSKPPTVIAEPFTPPVLNHVPSTRTQGNRFAVVTRCVEIKQRVRL